MNLMELQSEVADHSGLARVKVKITGTVDADGCVEVTCVETIVDDQGQTIVLSDERGG